MIFKIQIVASVEGALSGKVIEFDLPLVSSHINEHTPWLNLSQFLVSPHNESGRD